MTSVFLGGSRKVTRLNETIRTRLEEIVRRRLHIVIGDANGADRAMQRQLADWGYTDVTVYFVGKIPRNNEGSWQTRQLQPASSLKGFAFYAVKDQAMAKEAQCGLMLWDGSSRGTIANVKALAAAGKPVTVYLSRTKTFTNIRSVEDLDKLIPEEHPVGGNRLRTRQWGLDLGDKSN